MSVVKVIRVCDIQNLKPIFDDPSMDIKIIHLVRDPRGIESSRIKIGKVKSLESNSLLLCNKLFHNGICGLANTTDTKWLQGRYMRVRYEDLALQALALSKEIYRFVGLKMTPNVQSWIKAHTEVPIKKDINPFNTRRNSAAAVQSWRKHLSLDKIQIVQDVCSEPLKLFGYKLVANQSELENLNVGILR